MSDDTRISGILLLWEQLRDEGRPATPEHLCRDCPELLPEVRRRLEALRTSSGPESSNRVGRAGFVLEKGPGLTDETAMLLRFRLAVAGWILAAVSASSVLLCSIDPGYKAGMDRSDELAVVSVLVGFVVFTGLLYTPLARGMVALRTIELLLFGSAVVAIAWGQHRYLQTDWLHGIPAPGRERDLVILLSDNLVIIWFAVIVLYGTFIPNPWWRCLLVVGVMAAIPLVLTHYQGRLDRRLGDHLRRDTVRIMAIWMGVAMTMSIYGSHKIDKLRREAFQFRRLGQYQLLRPLGSGGMGQVFLAEHHLLRRPCAVKVIRRTDAGDARILARFEREVRAMASLTHWNTVEIYDYGHADDGTFYYVMEYLPGLDLDALVESDGPQPAGRVVHVLRQTCAALAEAHSIGLVHRDIKPGNVILCERGGVPDVVKLLDFGLVQSATPDAPAKLTREGTILGTPLFMSPEQAAGLPVDHTSDIYSLGALGYFLLTGRAPFETGTVSQILAAHLYEPVVPPRARRSDVPVDLDAAIVRCLAKKPEDRFGSVEALESALAACGRTAEWSASDARLVGGPAS